MPRWILAFIISSTAFALIPFAIAAKARNSHSNEPHIHIFPDMDFQPKYKSDNAMDVFADGRENRGEITGTIARGSLNVDDLYFRGLDNGQWTNGFPTNYPDGRKFVVDKKLLERGKNRFEIYCTPCHGYDGGGKGSVAQKSQDIHPAVLTTAVIATHPNGQLFNTVSNGANTMQGYAGQIPHADRWAIVAYLRALQRSQNAQLDDVPDSEKGQIQMPPMAVPAPATEGPK